MGRGAGHGGRQEIRAGMFAEEGVAAGKLQFEGSAEHRAFLETCGQIDVALNAFLYNSGTTTMEAIWQEVSVTTFQRSVAGRVTQRAAVGLSGCQCAM